MVAGGGDQLRGRFEVLAGFLALALGEKQAGLFEVVVGEMEAHAATGGQGEGFVEIALSGGEVAALAAESSAGEQAAGKVVFRARFAQALDGLVQMRRSFVASGRRRAAEGEMVEGDVEQ